MSRIGPHRGQKFQLVKVMQMTQERQSPWRLASRLALVSLLILSAGLAACGEEDDDLDIEDELEEELEE